MTSPFTREKIENWVGDFGQSPALARFPVAVQEAASGVLVSFLTHACRARDIEPEDLEQSDLRAALCEGAGARRHPAAVQEAIPDLCAAFLTDLEEQGRLADGATLGQYLRAMRGTFAEHVSDATPQLRSPGSKLGRNEPCPCGSGKKYKKCCMNLS